MHQSWFGAVTSENGSEYGVVRRFFFVGLVKPALLKMLPNVLAAGAVRGCRPAATLQRSPDGTFRIQPGFRCLPGPANYYGYRW
jgi:hypothetical protein